MSVCSCCGGEREGRGGGGGERHEKERGRRDRERESRTGEKEREEGKEEEEGVQSYVRHSHRQPTGHTVYSLKDHTRARIHKTGQTSQGYNRGCLGAAQNRI